MVPAALIEWLETNCTDAYLEHVKANRARTVACLEQLGVGATCDLAWTYLNFGAFPVRGWYELNEIDSIAEWTEYSRVELGVPPDYIALTSVEGQGITLYNLKTEAVHDVEFGQFEMLINGNLPPTARSFVEFLQWCMAKDMEHR